MDKKSLKDKIKIKSKNSTKDTKKVKKIKKVKDVNSKTVNTNSDTNTSNTKKVNSDDIKNTYLYQDCLKGMKKIADNSIDVIVTDPPYGIDYSNNRRNKNGRIKTENGIANDKDNIDFLRKVLKENYRVLKDGHHMYWFGRFDELPKQIIEMQKIGFTIKNQLIWVKNNHGTGDLYSSYAGKYESIIYAVKRTKKSVKLFHLQEYQGTRRPPDVLFYNKVPSKKMIHDHQKPIDLLEFLISKSSLKGDVVLDPFSGSTSTLIAANNVGRKFLGFEYDENNPIIYKEGLKRLTENGVSLKDINYTKNVKGKNK